VSAHPPQPIPACCVLMDGVCGVAALESLVKLKVDRILTSGMSNSAPLGKELLKKMVTAAGGRISIMAGGGVTPENVVELGKKCGVQCGVCYC